MEITIVHDSTIPLHVQLLNQLRHLILSGQWTPGSRIPSEPKFQQQLKISRSTIRQALNKAEAEGLIERVAGKGTFVASLPTGNNTNKFIGYIAPGLPGSDSQYRLLSGAEKAARDRGYRLLFSDSNQDVDEENKLLDQFLKDNVRGILIWPVINGGSTRRIVQIVQQGLIPVVLVDRTLPGLTCDHVISDNYAGAYAATQHLVEQGHQRIVFVSRSIFRLQPVAERLRGYQQALHDANLTPLDPWLIGTEAQEMLYPYAQAEIHKFRPHTARPNSEPDRRCVF